MERGKELRRNRTDVVEPIPTEVNARYRTIVVMRSNEVVVRCENLKKKKTDRIFVPAHNYLRLCWLLVEVVKPIRSSIKYFLCEQNWELWTELNSYVCIGWKFSAIDRYGKIPRMVREDEKYNLNKEIRFETNIWQLKKCELRTNTKSANWIKLSVLRVCLAMDGKRNSCDVKLIRFFAVPIKIVSTEWATF